MYQRPQITSNAEMRAGGLHIDVVEPFEVLRVTYDGDVCLLDEPLQMANPRQAFRDNPLVACTVDLMVRGISPMYGGRAVYDDDSEIPVDPEKSFAKAHYEQHTAVSGVITVGDEVIELDGYGLRDKSWGPRYWQAITWYRWLPIMFVPEFAMMLSVIGDPDGGPPRQAGMVLKDGEYRRLTSVRIESDFDDAGHQTAMRCLARTVEGDEYEVTGEVLSLIPLRNRRATPDGDQLMTRITEAMTSYRCGEYTGIGMSEYLDQVVDGRPIGPDLAP
jgi:hypothetical protein